MDARRQSDGLLVAMKSVKKNSQELQIARFLTSIQSRENHCVEVVDVLEDSLDTTCSIMVMKYLRQFDDPEFVMIGDVVDFVSQMLEVSISLLDLSAYSPSTGFSVPTPTTNRASVSFI